MLHLISKFHFNASLWERLDDGDAVLFLESGVYALLKESEIASLIEKNSRCITVHALQDDVVKRGIIQERLCNDVRLVDYQEFVTLTVNHEVVLTW